MDIKQANLPKLYALGYSDRTFQPFVSSFMAVGFELQISAWDNKRSVSSYSYNNVLAELESWQPDILFYWAVIGFEPEWEVEPPEWLALLHEVRTRPTLQHIKVMALFAHYYLEKNIVNPAWEDRYDFYAQGPLRVVNHTRKAKALVGQTILGFEGVLRYLKYLDESINEVNSRWIVHYPHSVANSLPDAEGQFEIPPLTQVLTIDEQGRTVWLKGGIQAERPIYIVFIVKEGSGGEQGLDRSEGLRLLTLAKSAKARDPNTQLLLGVNEPILQTSAEALLILRKQLYDVGGWQLFLNEHLWLEGEAFVGIELREIRKPVFERITMYGLEGNLKHEGSKIRLGWYPRCI